MLRYNKEFLKTMSVALFVFFLTFVVVFKTPINNMDEIWGFQFARRILYGEIPYRDFFMVVTPFSSQFNAFVLYLTSDELIYMRLIALVIVVLNGVVFWEISKRLRISPLFSVLPIGCLCLSFTYFPFNNYSWFALLFVSVIFLLLFIEARGHALLIGGLLGLTFFTKQNIGVYMSLAFIFITLRQKWPFLPIAKVLSGFTLVAMIELFYLSVNNTMPDFTDILLINPLRFSSQCSISYSQLFFGDSFLIKIIALLMPLILLTLIYLTLTAGDDKKKQHFTVLLLFCLISAGFLFPMADSVHLLMAFPPFGLALSYVLNNSNRKSLDYSYLMNVILTTFILTAALQINVNSFNNQYESKLPHLSHLPIGKEQEKTILTIKDFILTKQHSGEKVYIVDFRAALFDIVTDNPGLKYNTMLLGNFASNGEEEVISQIKSDKNATILLGDGANPLEQKKIRKYVQTHLLRTGSIENFYDIYRHTE